MSVYPRTPLALIDIGWQQMPNSCSVKSRAVIAASFLRHDSLHQVIQGYQCAVEWLFGSLGRGDHAGATEVVLVESCYGGGSYDSLIMYLQLAKISYAYVSEYLCVCVSVCLCRVLCEKCCLTVTVSTTQPLACSTYICDTACTRGRICIYLCTN